MSARYAPAIGGRVLRGRRLSMRFAPRTAVVCPVLLVAALAVGAVSLSVGDFPVPVTHLPAILFGRGVGAESFIVTGLRLPRVLCALLIGAALGVAGAIFQSLARNPLASPDIVGFNTGAATGAILTIVVVGGGMLSVSLAALVGGVATAGVVYLLALKRGVQGFGLVLVGIGVAALLSSVNAYLLTRAPQERAMDATVWLTGSLNGRGWAQVWPVAIGLVVLLPAALVLGRDLRLLELGDDASRQLGVPAERTRLLMIGVSVALTALATVAAGPIAFVALASPQLARRLTRATGPGLVPAALMGALLLTVGDLGAQRLLAPTQLPVGVVTGVLGGVYLLWLLVAEWRKGRG